MDIHTLETSILRKYSKNEQSRLREVIQYAKNHLHSEIRKSGENYAQHGLELAWTINEMVTDPRLTAVAILHDLEIHPKGKDLLKNAPIDEEEKYLIKEMHKLRGLHISTEEKDLDTFLDHTSQQAALIPLRIAHRLNDVRHLDRFQEKLQEKIAQESLHMYASIAGRLGMHRWRYEMEDICFIKLQKKAAEALIKKFKDSREIDEISLKQTRAFIQKKCKEANISVKIESRFKALYSSYRKMLLKNRHFDELTDRLALRVIVKNIDECYRTLGIIHSHMHPIAGKLKDYIGIPKENGYQSIHTVVYPLPGVTEQAIEIQIRSKEMQQLCEYGTASHGEYKNLNYSLKTSNAQIDLIKNFQILRSKTKSPKQFNQALRNYFDEKHMGIFDEKNNLYHIKRPASILEFLTIIYPKKVQYIREVKRNGRKEHLEATLQDGDVIEAIWRSHRNIQKKSENQFLSRNITTSSSLYYDHQ